MRGELMRNSGLSVNEMLTPAVAFAFGFNQYIMSKLKKKANFTLND